MRYPLQRKVKIMRSSYNGSQDINGIPTYFEVSGDLDICNGIFGPTPEYP